MMEPPYWHPLVTLAVGRYLQAATRPPEYCLAAACCQLVITALMGVRRCCLPASPPPVTRPPTCSSNARFLPVDRAVVRHAHHVVPLWLAGHEFPSAPTPYW